MRGLRAGAVTVIWRAYWEKQLTTEGINGSPRHKIWQALRDGPDTAGKIGSTTARPVHAPCAPCARAPGSSSASDDVFFWLGDFAELRKLAKTPPEKRGTRVASLTGSQRPARAAATYNSWRQRFERSPPRRLAERTRWRGATERSATLRLSERCAAPLASGAAGSAHGPADQHGQSCRAMPPRRCRGSTSAVSASLRPRIGATRMPL